MRILCVSDEEDKYLWDYYEPGRLDDIDFVLAAGDLNALYLEFLATFVKGPVFYVPGNHDSAYLQHPPEGCHCIDDKLVIYNGVRILGLGGSMCYRLGPYQYSEREMRRRVKRRKFDLWRRHGLDILLTHSPAQGLNDGMDLPHHGFACFGELIDLYQPAYHVYGHVHPAYNAAYKPIERVGKTQLVNAYKRAVIEL